MTQQMVVYLARRSLMAVLMIGGPILIAGLVVGVTVAIFQAVTSIREITLVMIPKIAAVVVMIFWLLPWMLNVMVTYTSNTLQWVQYFGS